MSIKSTAQEWGTFHCECYDRDWNLKWVDDAHNALTNEGQYMFLDVVLRDGTDPTTFYIRLFNDTPVKTDAISNLTGEPAGTYGYAAAEVTRGSTASGWPTLEIDTADEMATSKTVTFTASGGVIGPVTYACLTSSTDSSGKLIAYGQLSTSRTLQDGDSLQVTYKMKQV